MLAKATLRLPEPLLEKLRERSRQEGRSLNETAIHVLEQGLGGTVEDEGWLALGSVLEELPTRRYDADALRKRWVRLGPGTRGLHDDLDWARGER
jgi:Arc-like DNA binding domain